MEISDIKIAITAVCTIVIALTVVAYLASQVSDAVILGLASAGIGAVAGLAGYDMGSKNG